MARVRTGGAGSGYAWALVIFGAGFVICLMLAIVFWAQLGGAREQAEQAQLHQVVPDDWLPKAHHWLILHGRYTCTARLPNCPGCPVADLCPSRAMMMATGQARGSTPSSRSRTARAKAAPRSGAEPR